MKKITLKKKMLSDKSFSVTLYREEECIGPLNSPCNPPETQCGCGPTNEHCGFLCGFGC